MKLEQIALRVQNLDPALSPEFGRLLIRTIGGKTELKSESQILTKLAMRVQFGVIRFRAHRNSRVGRSLKSGVWPSGPSKKQKAPVRKSKVSSC